MYTLAERLDDIIPGDNTGFHTKFPKEIEIIRCCGYFFVKLSLDCHFSYHPYTNGPHHLL